MYRYEFFEKRANGYKTVQYTESPGDLAKMLARHRYTSVGSYPLFAITDDGGCLCRECCKSEFRQILASAPGDGWHVNAIDVNWEDPDLYCDQCSELIESAYAD